MDRETLLLVLYRLTQPFLSPTPLPLSFQPKITTTTTTIIIIIKRIIRVGNKARWRNTYIAHALIAAVGAKPRDRLPAQEYHTGEVLLLLLLASWVSLALFFFFRLPVAVNVLLSTYLRHYLSRATLECKIMGRWRNKGVIVKQSQIGGETGNKNNNGNTQHTRYNILFKH